MIKLMYWLLFPLRVYKRMQINKELKRRLEAAKDKACNLAFKTKRTHYVCQNAHEFFIGTSEQMKNTEKAFKKHGIKWTWEKHIKFATK